MIEKENPLNDITAGPQGKAVTLCFHFTLMLTSSQEKQNQDILQFPITKQKPTIIYSDPINLSSCSIEQNYLSFLLFKATYFVDYHPNVCS